MLQYNLDPSQGSAGAGGALETLLEKMPIGENADMAIILAGYTEPMKQLFRNANEGLKSRFVADDPWLFEDYTDRELLKIFMRKASDDGVKCAYRVMQQAVEHLSLQRRAPAFGNARAVETMLSGGKVSLQMRANSARLERAAAASAGVPAASLPPVPDSLVLGDLVREQTSVEKARRAFDGMVGVPAVCELVDRLVAMSETAAADGQDPASVVGEMHMTFVGPAGKRERRAWRPARPARPAVAQPVRPSLCFYRRGVRGVEHEPCPCCVVRRARVRRCGLQAPASPRRRASSGSCCTTCACSRRRR